MDPHNITEGGWFFRFLVEMGDLLTPIVFLAGMGVAVWAFLRCRKCGYLVIAISFAISVFALVAMPAINRTIRAHQPPDYDVQTQQKIDAAVQQAIAKVLADEGHPYCITQKHTIRFPFEPILLVVGLWLVARREIDRKEIS